MIIVEPEPKHTVKSMGGQKQPLLPKNWPQDLPFLTRPAYSPALTSAQLRALRTRPAPADCPDLREVPASLPPGPCASVRITPISDPAHPACGQAGLFAARALPAAALVLPYLGVVHPGRAASRGDEDEHAASDYDLWLDRGGGGDDDGGVAVDASARGNEARFVNDYRGVPGARRPNAEFAEVWDARTGERGMAVFVLPAGKRRERERGKGGGGGGSGKRGQGGGIAKGEEILVSYGKGFWGKRREEEEMAQEDGAEGEPGEGELEGER